LILIGTKLTGGASSTTNMVAGALRGETASPHGVDIGTEKNRGIASDKSPQAYPGNQT
jgi:hypothetical protein